MKRTAMTGPPQRGIRIGIRERNRMPILRRIIIAAMAAAMLSAAPAAALASTSQPGTTPPTAGTSIQPGGTIVLKPAGANAAINLTCSIPARGLSWSAGHFVQDTTSVKCNHRAAKIIVEACVQQFLHGKWRSIICKTNQKRNVASLTVTAKKNCTNRNRNEFRGKGHVTVTASRGHTSTVPLITNPVFIACGTQ